MPWQYREIKGERYTKHDDQEIWRPEKNGQPFVCRCGSETFTLHFPVNTAYALNAKCTVCGLDEEVYSG
jgi:hypothetical protein